MQLNRCLRWGLTLGALALLSGLAVRGLWIHARLEYGVHIARQALSEGDATKAREALEAIEPWGAGRAEVQYLLGVANRREGRLNHVEPYLTRAAELGWPVPDLKRQRALAAFQSGRISESKPYLEGLMLRGVGDEAALEIYEGMTKGYLLDLRLRDAERCLKFWIAWRPNEAQPRLWLADVWHSILDHERERKELADLLAIQPNNVEARQKYGECFLQVNDIPQALAEFGRCHEIAPREARFVMLMAHCHYRLGDSAQAEQLLNESRKLQIDDFQESFAWTTLGQIDLEQKRYQEAEVKLRRALELTPGNEMAHFSLATALTRLGKKDEAERHFQTATAMEEEDVRLADLTRNVMNRPDDSASRLEVGRILLNRGTSGAGLRWLRSALMVKPNDRTIHEELATAYEKQGNHELAAEHRRSAELLPRVEPTANTAPSDSARSPGSLPSAAEKNAPSHTTNSEAQP